MAKTSRHIALVCPGGPITRDLAERVTALAETHFKNRLRLTFHEQCFLQAGHFAGTDAERTAAFLEVANDPSVDAVWAARGGYGAGRLDPALFGKLNDAARAKTYIGYSDFGVILGKLYREKVGRQAHAPIAVDLDREGGEAAILRVLRFLTDGETGLEPSLDDAHPSAAFNITVLANMIATPWMPDLSGHVLYFEDVGEYLYRIDRAMFGIMNAPGMDRLAGVRLGRISAVPENDRPFGQTAEEIVRYWCGRAGVPYLGRANIGHDADNKIVPFGAPSMHKPLA